jgi:2-iminobutanoate/2-iminopropanoate deaminase
VRLAVYVTDMTALRPLVNKIQEEIWTGGPYPPRTILQVSALAQNDIFEVDGTFYAPTKADRQA